MHVTVGKRAWRGRVYSACENLEKEAGTSSVKNEMLQSAVAYIEGNYGETVTLMKYRIKAAKKHLAFTDLPLKEIAGRCGFKTVPHFSRTFKAVTGETPAAFRTMALEKRKKSR